MPVEAPVMRTEGSAVMGLLIFEAEFIFMMNIMIILKYDDHHIYVNRAAEKLV